MAPPRGLAADVGLGRRAPSESIDRNSDARHLFDTGIGRRSGSRSAQPVRCRSKMEARSQTSGRRFLVVGASQAGLAISGTLSGSGVHTSSWSGPRRRSGWRTETWDFLRRQRARPGTTASRAWSPFDVDADGFGVQGPGRRLLRGVPKKDRRTDPLRSRGSPRVGDERRGSFRSDRRRHPSTPFRRRGDLPLPATVFPPIVPRHGTAADAAPTPTASPDQPRRAQRSLWTAGSLDPDRRELRASGREVSFSVGPHDQAPARLSRP